MTQQIKKSKKEVSSDWKLIGGVDDIENGLEYLCRRIVDGNRYSKPIALVGIRTNGEHLARRMQNIMKQQLHTDVDIGIIDITLYRDDLVHESTVPTIQETDLPFSVNDTRIVLVDDVFFTGRTIRAALDAVIDFGRPWRVDLAVLVDRGHRHYPIRPDYVARTLETRHSDFVRVLMEEEGYQDGIYFIPGKKKNGSKKKK